MSIYQIHPRDTVFDDAIIYVLNQHHSGRVSQATLNFWRFGRRKFIDDNGGDIVFLAAILQGSIVGVSCCAVRNKSRVCFASTTIVSRHSRRLGIGTSLLRAKLKLLAARYSESLFVCHGNESNEYALRILNKSGLARVVKARKEIRGKEVAVYTFTNSPRLYRGHVRKRKAKA